MCFIVGLGKSGRNPFFAANIGRGEKGMTSGNVTDPFESYHAFCHKYISALEQSVAPDRKEAAALSQFNPEEQNHAHPGTI